MKYTTIIDLSMPVTTQTPIYPGDPKPEVTPSATIEGEGYNVSHLHMGSHTGTTLMRLTIFARKERSLMKFPFLLLQGKEWYWMLQVKGKESLLH